MVASVYLFINWNGKVDQRYPDNRMIAPHFEDQSAQPVGVLFGSVMGQCAHHPGEVIKIAQPFGK